MNKRCEDPMKSTETTAEFMWVSTVGSGKSVVDLALNLLSKISVDSQKPFHVEASRSVSRYPKKDIEQHICPQSSKTGSKGYVTKSE